MGRHKCGIGIRLFYNNISMAFVGAHLMPRDENYGTRIKNYCDIIEGMKFSDQPNDGILDQE